MNEKLRLSAGPPTAARVIGVIAGLIFAFVGTAFVVLPLLADGYLRSMFGGDPSCDGLPGVQPDALPPGLQSCADPGFPSAGLGFPGADGLGAFRFVGLVGVPFALLGLYVVLRSLRTAVWLDGTTLRVRRAFSTRAIDLSTAEVSVNTVTHRTTGDGYPVITQIPTLIAKDPHSRRRAAVTLRLPGHELRQLADAMTLNRSTAGRDADAQQIATQLRQIAANPLQLR